VDGQPIEQSVRFGGCKSGPLYEEPCGRLHWAGLFDKLPFPRTAADVIEQGASDGRQVGLSSRDHEYWPLKRYVQALEVHNIEPGKSNALQ
jgi:hypothetical protein